MTEQAQTTSESIAASDQLSEHEALLSQLAADFACELHFHWHRGVINCGNRYVLFGNDGFKSDARSRNEAEILMQRLAVHKPTLGQSKDGYTWAIVLTDHSRQVFDEHELHEMVWEAWAEVCKGPRQ